MTSECSSTSYEHLFRSLARHSRLFPLRSSDVALLATPTDFYQQLVHNIQHAERRISISSLYLGTGHLERDLVDALATRLKERPQLQDRYVQLTSCGALAQFYHQFVELVTGFSYKVKLDSLTSDKNDYELLAPVLAHDSEKAKTAMRRDLEKLVDSSKYQQDKDDELTDAWVFPTLQFTPISMDHDERVLSEFVRHLPRGSQLQIASGYLNFPPFLSELLERCEAGLDVISAAPRANGFYDARGVKGALPMAYSLIEQDFFERTLGREFPTVLREFNRLGWTFHGKGMWWRPPPPAVTNGHQSAVGLPQLTVVGSSNFGQRSYGCDLESNLVLFTRNADLQQRLQDEYDALTRDAEVVTEQLWRRPERMLHGLFSWKDGHWIRPVSKFIAAYL
ncbi:hypothetical protein PPTG_01991 [Phytophthora nicotianae INRA-310]|uniref:CDP-diacylglycerol--glycerol-3-phosphate 3-phosphatidyltransferase n=1 Tax=Phytophthora nicotianae (strain INRA-310) TaxID=761204 RepID=W2RB51_PHYN3|nr:hypothetical protein PPTG_01991 [Phytophthora nicotianae INRA-310]ETN21919.1 hypothetical protein PPTG_01991 [Phytophthora nicotianae INRA-310]